MDWKEKALRGYSEFRKRWEWTICLSALFCRFVVVFSAYVFGIRGTVVLRDALRFDNVDVIHITGKFLHQRFNSECVMKFSNRSFLIMARDSAYRVLYHLYHSSESV